MPTGDVRPITGWICPVCHRGVAPHVTVCPCNNSFKQPSPYHPPHIPPVYGDPDPSQRPVITYRNPTVTNGKDADQLIQNIPKLKQYPE